MFTVRSPASEKTSLAAPAERAQTPKKIMSTRLSFAVAALCLTAGVRPASAYQEMEPVRQTKEVTSGLNYLLYLPNGHDPLKSGWPVIVFMHGSGESSNNVDSGLNALTKHSLPRVVEDDDWDWPFIVVSPQIESGVGWASQETALTAVLTRLQTEFGADPNRFYLTGLSYGGSGTWNLGMNMIGTWAALMPLCAGGSQGDVTTLADTPMFVIHGTADPDNEFQQDRDRVDLMIGAGVAFHEFDYARADEPQDAWPMTALDYEHVFASMIDYEHDVWDATYGFVDMGTSAVLVHKTVPYQWLLEQSLDGSTFVDPRTAPVAGSGGTGGVGGTGGSSGAGAGGGGAGGTAGSGGSAGSGGVTAMGGMASSGASAGPSMAQPQSEPTESGCACRAGSQGRGSAALYWLVSLGALIALRRRKHL
jgi:MYXO-CTERM domain-containing protein